MIQYGLMKERVPDVDLGRAKTAIAELTKAFPPDSINPAVKCFARCGAGGYSQYNMQKLACFDTLEGKVSFASDFAPRPPREAPTSCRARRARPPAPASSQPARARCVWPADQQDHLDEC